MINEHTDYKSVLGPNICSFLTEKRACGFKYVNPECILKGLDTYWFEHSYQEPYLVRENIEPWCTLRENEAPSTFAVRLSTVREFSRFLCGLGFPSYIPQINVKNEFLEPYIFTQEELKSFFEQVDSLGESRLTKNTIRLGNEYPVLFRFLYLNGTRVSETCSLSLSQVNLSDGIVTILNGKNDKDRLIYLSEDMTVLCREYVEYLKRTLGSPEWLFPGEDPSKPLSRHSVLVVFDKCWSKVPFASEHSKKPVVHDLRHSFVTHRIDDWVAQGVNFNEMRPYLSKHLGHKSFKDTAYYYHFTRDAAKNIHNLDKTSNNVIPEVPRV